MIICSQHGAIRTFGQSALTIGPFKLYMVQKWQLGSSNPETVVVSNTRLGKNPLRRKSPECSVTREAKKPWEKP